MARFTAADLSSVERQILKRGDSVKGTVSLMLEAGAAVQKEHNKLTISAMFDAHDGGLRDSFIVGNLKTTASSSYIEVYPKGTNKYKQRYALIGAVLNYGRANMPPRPWFEESMNAAEPEVREAMLEEWNKSNGS
jgi:hypothetical protein